MVMNIYLEGVTYISNKNASYSKVKFSFPDLQAVCKI